MPNKKHFTEALNPALQFISAANQDTAPTAPATEERTVHTSTSRESKSKRLQLLIKPSTYNRIRARAEAEDTSVNDLINRILEQET